MIAIGIVFIALIVIVLFVVDNSDDRNGLITTLIFAGVICVFAAFVVREEATDEAIKLYKENKIVEQITIKNYKEDGIMKADTLYNYSRP